MLGGAVLVNGQIDAAQEVAGLHPGVDPQIGGGQILQPKHPVVRFAAQEQTVFEDQRGSVFCSAAQAGIPADGTAYAQSHHVLIY